MYREKGTVATTSNNDKTDISIEHTPPPAPASPTNISINPVCQGGGGANKFQKNVEKCYQTSHAEQGHTRVPSSQSSNCTQNSQVIYLIYFTLGQRSLLSKTFRFQKKLSFNKFGMQ